jgi:ribosome-associated protein
MKRKTGASTTQVTRSTSNDLSTAIKAVIEKKAEELVALDLREIASFTDYFLICSGTSTRQVQAIADEVVEKLKEQGARPLHVEGYSSGQWVLIDYGDMIVHVFEQRAREFYDLERLWRDAKRLEVNQT